MSIKRRESGGAEATTETRMAGTLMDAVALKSSKANSSPRPREIISKARRRAPIRYRTKVSSSWSPKSGRDGLVQVAPRGYRSAIKHGFP